MEILSVISSQSLRLSRTHTRAEMKEKGEKTQQTMYITHTQSSNHLAVNFIEKKD